MTRSPIMLSLGRVSAGFPKIVCAMLAAATLAIAGQSARAELKTYIITTLNQSGTIGSTSFTDATIRVSYTGDTAALSGNTYSMSGTSINFSVFGGNLSAPLNGTFASADSWQLGGYTASGAWIFTTWKSGVYLPAFGFKAPEADRIAQSSTTFANNRAMLLSSYSQTVASLPSAGTTNNLTFNVTGGATPSANWFSAGSLGSGVSSSLGTFRINAPSSTTYYNGSIQTVPEPSTVAMALAGLACGGWSLCRRKRRVRQDGRSTAYATSLALVAACVATGSAEATPITIDWVTVGDPGNTADNTGNPNPTGAVADAFQIMKYEVTNTQYAAFLNAVASTDTYSLYNTSMGSSVGGITRSGSSGSYAYTVRTNMGDKPVNSISWFDAARFANWLQNGQGSGSTETGAYTLVAGQTSGTAPARNAGATFYIPTVSQWYKAAFYKGGGTNAGYWDYATQSNTAPTPVTSGSTGIGSAGSTGNSANYNRDADWNSLNGNVTTVGSNGGPSAYGAFDMGGNVQEWNDAGGTASTNKMIRGGAWNELTATNLSSSYSNTIVASAGDGSVGFRLASPVPVPEPSTCILALAGLACGGVVIRRNRLRKPSDRTVAAR